MKHFSIINFHEFNYHLLIFIHASVVVPTATLFFQETLSKKSLAFADFKPGKKLAESLIAAEPATSVIACALKCSKFPNCKSFNHCEKNHCELNYKDIHDSSASVDLISDLSCNYFGMEKNEVPKCKERGTKIQIRDDDVINICQIKRKRLDAHWLNERHEVVTDTDSDWRKDFVRDCWESAHGGHSG